MPKKLPKVELSSEQEKAVAMLAGGFLYGFVAAYVEAGVAPSEAVKLAGAALLEVSIGERALVDLGLDPSTAYKWRRQMREAAERVPEVMPDVAIGRFVRSAMSLE